MAENALPHVIFRLGHQPFAIALADVKGVAKTPAIIAVPHAEKMVRGLTVLREQLAAALDLRLRFGLAPSAHPEICTALAVEHEGERVALLVDRLEDVAILPPLESIAPARDPLWQGVVAGIARRGDETIVVLDVAGILDGAMAE